MSGRNDNNRDSMVIKQCYLEKIPDTSISDHTEKLNIQTLFYGYPTKWHKPIL